MTIRHDELGNNDVHPAGYVDSSFPGGTVSAGEVFLDTDTDRYYFYGAAIAWPGAPTANGNWHVFLDQRDYAELVADLSAHEADSAAHAVAEPVTVEDPVGVDGFISTEYLAALLAVGAGGYELGGTDFPEVTATDGTFSATIGGNSFSSQIRLASETHHGFMSKADKSFIVDHDADEAAAHPVLDGRVTALEALAFDDTTVLAHKAYCMANRGYRTYSMNSAGDERNDFVIGGATLLYPSFRSANTADCFGDWTIPYSADGVSYLQHATFKVDDVVWDSGTYPQELDIYVPLGGGTGTVRLEVWDMDDSGASVTVNLTEDITADPVVWHAPAVDYKDTPDSNDAFKFTITVGNTYRVAISWSADTAPASMIIKPWYAIGDSTTYLCIDAPLMEAFILQPRSISE